MPYLDTLDELDAAVSQRGHEPLEYLVLVGIGHYPAMEPGIYLSVSRPTLLILVTQSVLEPDSHAWACVWNPKGFKKVTRELFQRVQREPQGAQWIDHLQTLDRLTRFAPVKVAHVYGRGWNGLDECEYKHVDFCDPPEPEPSRPAKQKPKKPAKHTEPKPKKPAKSADPDRSLWTRIWTKVRPKRQELPTARLLKEGKQ